MSKLRVYVFVILYGAGEVVRRPADANQAPWGWRRSTRAGKLLTPLWQGWGTLDRGSSYYSTLQMAAGCITRNVA